MQLPCAKQRAPVGLLKTSQGRSGEKARVRRSVVLPEGPERPKREGWMDVVDGNLQSLCSSAVMSTINKRNVVR